MNLQPGSVLGPYQIVAELGRGAMGAVFRARHLQAQREVALKVILRAENARSVQRFVREAQVVASLDHPGIVRVLEAGAFGGLPCIAYELVEGGQTLQEAFASHLLIERVELVLQVAEALAHVHAAGLIHRDIKPGNVLLDRGQARLTDFGLVGGEDLERLTKTGGLVGTPGYMAPEQIECQREAIGPHSDVWALGVLLYEALTLSLPFEGATAVEVMVRARHSAPTPPSTASAEPMPNGAEVVCLRALEKDPAQRYPSAAEFHEALSAVLDGTFQRPSRLGLAAGLVAAALILLGGLAFALTRGRAPEPEPAQVEPSASASAAPAATPTTLAGWARLARQEADAGRAEQALAAWSAVLEQAPEDPDALLGLARVNHELGRREPAQVALERLLVVAPDHSEAYYRLANVRFEAKGAWETPPELNREVDSAQGYFHRGLTRQRARAFRGALDDYTEVLRRQPGDQGAYNNRGNLRADLGDYRGALEDFSEAIRRGAASDTLLNRASVLSKLGRQEEVLADAQAALEIDPESVRALCARSGALRELKRFDEAERTLERAHELGPRSERVQIERALLCVARGQIKEAEVLYERLLEAFPGHAVALNNLAALHIDHGDPERGEGLLRRLLEEKPHDAMALANLAAILLRRGQVDEAVALSKRATEASPEQLGLGLTYAAALIRAEDYATALAEVQRLLNADPTLARAYYVRAKALARLKRGKEALAAYARALELEPNSIEFLKQRGTYHLNNARYREALADFDRLIGLEPSGDAHTYRGHAKLQLGDQPGAEKDYQEAIRLDPRAKDALNNLSALLAQDKKWRRTLPLLTSLIEIAPEVPTYRYSRAEAYFELRQFEPATRDCLAFLERNPNDPEGLILLGRSWQGLGKHAQAAPRFQAVVQRDPKNLRALAYLSDSLQALGDWQRTIECFDRMIELLRERPALADKIRAARVQAEAQLKAQKR